MKRRLVTAVLAVIGLAFAFASPASAAAPAVPVPNVTGPIAVTENSYPFLATDIDLSQYGYVEEEFFIDGNALTYDLTPSNDPAVTASRIETGGPNADGTYPFKTRIVVRRPANPADANGTVVAEWYNVTAFRDIEWNWAGDPDYMLRNGYTFVGVSAQKVGIDGLKAFNASRYGTLDVSAAESPPPAQNRDLLSFDIYGAALNALKGNRASGPDPLGGITADTVIASGESQSCSRLSTHYNKIQPLQNIADAYLLTVCGSQLRADRPEKAIRIITETENRTPFPTSTFPDNGSLRHWESAGGSHLPRLAWDNVAPLLNRDFLPITVGCQKFPLSLVQWPLTANRAIKGLTDWVQDGVAPPIAPRGTYEPNPDYTPPTSPGNQPERLVRDQYGIAQGGIRYPEITVPTGVNDGVNSGGTGGNPLFSAFCGLLGSNTLFERPTLDSLYTDFADYVSQYSDAVDQFLTTDFILAEDAPRLKEISRQFPELQPTAPMKAGSKLTKGTFNLNWVGTEAPDTTFQLQQQSSKEGAAWVSVSKFRGEPNGAGQLRSQPQGTFAYRVRSSTVIPKNNIAEARTTTTPFSRPSVQVKVDRSGPPAPRIAVKGKRIGPNTYRGKVQVRVIGRADGKLPDGSAGAGLNRKSVPKTRTIRKKGRSVISVQTRDRLGNRSKTTRLVIRIR